MATRDLPHSVGDFCFGWVDQIRSEITLGKSQDQLIKEDVLEDDETVETKVEIKIYGQHLLPAQVYFLMDMLMLVLVRYYHV